MHIDDFVYLFIITDVWCLRVDTALEHSKLARKTELFIADRYSIIFSNWPIQK